jgi:hypothetical protein
MMPGSLFLPGNIFIRGKMILTQNITDIISLVIDLLKSIYIFPGFTLFQGIGLIVSVSIAIWVLGAFGGIINIGGGGGE